MDISQRRTLILGTAAYLILGVLALMYYLERTVFIDLAFHTVTILKTKGLFIQNQRFVAAVSQVFPLLAQGLNFSLKGVLMSYSAGFVVYYGTVFLLCTRWLGQWKMGLVMLFCSTLMTTDTFYWIQSELPQGMALLPLIFAILLRYRSLNQMPGWALSAVFVLWYVVAFAHPMLLFPSLFMVLFFWERNAAKAEIDSKLVLASGVFLLSIVLIKNKLLGTSGYDQEAMSRVKNLLTLFPHYFNIASNRDFLHWCLTDYYFLILGLGLNTYYYIREQKWFKLALALCFFGGYLLLVNVSFVNGFDRFYIENLYLPLCIYVAVPLVMDVLPNLKRGQTSGTIPVWIFGALALVTALRLLRIAHAHHAWTDRLDWERSLLAETANLPRPKLLLTEKQVPMDKLKMSWGSSFEFMLLSALDDPQKMRMIMIDEDPARMNWAAGNPHAVITEWEVMEYDKLPKRYFNPQDTTIYELNTSDFKNLPASGR
jgi:hypothetical protein